MILLAIYMLATAESAEELRVAEDAGGQEEATAAPTGIPGQQVEISLSVPELSATPTTKPAVRAESTARPTSPGGGLHEEGDPGATEPWYSAPLGGGEGAK